MLDERDIRWYTCHITPQQRQILEVPMKKLVSLILALLCLSLLAAAWAESAVKVGDIITFGHYEQDNNKKNGKEPIEWRVLDVQDGKALLISFYALDCKKYNDRQIGISWEHCSLRRWLNKQFLEAAFSADDMEAVILSHIDNSLAQSRPDWQQFTPNDTDDYVFLLSYAEADRYFADDKDRQTIPTAYAKRCGSWDSAGFLVDGKRPCWYWLRTMGYNASNTAVVIDSGIIKNQHVTKPGFSVRPCIWLDLEKAGY